ncbi:MAG: heparinase II/III family protein [Planctomycetes bacterium]|nr:heparinase II/III family protein [Planctomycetota bacterium]
MFIRPPAVSAAPNAPSLLSPLAVLAVLGGAAACLAASPAPAVTVPEPGRVLATLRPKHPRLVLTDRRLAELKRLAETDELLARSVRDVNRLADRLARRPVLVRKLVGPRLLSVSRDCLARMYAFGLAWRWNGNERYFRKALENLRAVCRFTDWNPKHFLDTAEMSHAVAIGYDWFYEKLGEADRRLIREGLIELGMKPGLTVYSRGGWWTATRFNWNQVCNMGLVIGSLAIADTDPQYAEKIIPAALKSLPRALATYAPDGAWPEGPGYWGYATRYTVCGLAAMQTALGRDFGLGEIPGLSQAGWFPIYLTGPTGMYFNFADTSGHGRRRNIPALFWLARRYRQPLLAGVEREMIARRGAEPRDVIWYVPPAKGPLPRPPTAKLFRGPVEVAVFRAAWGDPNALFAAVKAGYNQVNHGHLDLGSFEMDALGVRWARELGSDNYNLPAYWARGRGGQRWKYYRLGSRSHSVPLLDDRNQDPYAKARIVKFRGPGDDGLAVVDFTSAYKPLASKALRGLRMIRGRAVLVQDELTITAACRAAWAMTTDARIATAGREATLTLDGRSLTARILAPDGASFSVESAEQKPPQATNKSVRRLMIRTPADKGLLRFAVLLSPRWPDGKVVRSTDVVPLDEWK